MEYPKEEPKIIECIKEVRKEYDLEERTARFGENIITFAKKVPKILLRSR